MRLQIEGSSQLETEPVGRPIEDIFRDIIIRIHDGSELNAQTNDMGSVAQTSGVTQASIIVHKNDSDVSVQLKNEYGSQETGYLIELTIEDSGDVDPEIIKSVNEGVLIAIGELVPLTEKTQDRIS